MSETFTQDITVFISTFLETNGIAINNTNENEPIDNAPVINIIQGTIQTQVVLQTEFAFMSVFISNQLAQNDPVLQASLDEFLVNYNQTKAQVEAILGNNNIA